MQLSGVQAGSAGGPPSFGLLLRVTSTDSVARWTTERKLTVFVSCQIPWVANMFRVHSSCCVQTTGFQLKEQIRRRMKIIHIQMVYFALIVCS